MDLWSERSIRRNRQWLMAYVIALTGDGSAADDLVQQVFTVAFEKKDSFEPGTNFGGWLREIARRVVLRHCERRSRRPLFEGEDAHERLDRAAAEAEERALGSTWLAMRVEFLRQCVRQLPEEDRGLVEQRYGRGLSTAEIASSSGKTVSAVNVALFRARMALAECVRRKEST